MSNCRPLLILPTILIITTIVTILFSSRHLWLDNIRMIESIKVFNSNPPSTEIPNIVHFVHLLPPLSRDAHPPLQFEFRHFISVYSAYLYLSPNEIYIHTDAAPDVVQQARDSLHPWTRAIVNLPTVIFHYETAPNVTTTGMKIVKLPNKSDFVRTRVMKRWGGIYLDEDVYILKNLSALRHAGFQNVVGRQENGQICPALFLSTPENELIIAYNALQDNAFDGGWSTHAVELLDRLVLEFSVRDRHVLVLEQDAFFPGHWDNVGMIYQVHKLKGVEESLEIKHTDPLNMTSFMESFKRGPQKTWIKDWRVSYALHGWNTGLAESKKYFGKFGGITLEYVLAKNSNFARAVYPAVKHALDNDVIPRLE